MPLVSTSGAVVPSRDPGSGPNHARAELRCLIGAKRYRRLGSLSDEAVRTMLVLESIEQSLKRPTRLPIFNNRKHRRKSMLRKE